MGLLVRIIHWLPALAGLAVCVALIPLSTLVGRRLGAIRRRLVAHTDARVKLCTEVITGEAGCFLTQLPTQTALPRALATCLWRGPSVAARHDWPPYVLMRCRVVADPAAGIKAIKLYAWCGCPSLPPQFLPMQPCWQILAAQQSCHCRRCQH